ncbi:MAG: aldehyde dehydrogenase family protein, partial [Alphaproteobacteria bacterium]|nr:aldehyde dehydrogenase family protein [Alphaproteobacteria bacterium]
MTDIVCISPIDGHEVARRPVATDAQIDATLKAARAAQREWAKVSIKDRCAFALKFMDAMLSLNQEIVPELAAQMGRPVRFGGEFRGFEERVRYMTMIAEDSL